MQSNKQSTDVSRRDFLRMVAGGTFGLAAGGLLAGCGGGGNSAAPVGRGQSLVVSTFTGGTIERYDVATGAHQQTLRPVANAGPAGIALAPDKTLWVANRFQGALQHWDLNTGASIGVINNIHAPHSCAVGPDGNLYAPNAVSYFGGSPTSEDTIEKFNALTGEHLGVFTHTPLPFSLVWGPDGALYSSSTLELGNTHPHSDSIKRFNGQTGALLNVVVNGDKVPFDMLFTQHGTILVSEFIDNRIEEYDLATGASVRTLASVDFPIGMAYGPDGNIWVGSFSDRLSSVNSGSVVRIDPNTGAHQGTFVSGLSQGAFVLFV